MSVAQTLKGRTAFITGASRGIGLEIAKSLALRGANVAVAAKTSDPHPKLPGTIHSAADEVSTIGEQSGSGAQGLAIKVDVREASAVEAAIEETVAKFGTLDMIVNNASAISLKPTVETSPKSYDLMHQINARGTWLVSRYALPHLLRSHDAGRNPQILTMSPPLRHNMFALDNEHGCYPDAFEATRAAYTMSKFGMSLAAFALAAEFRGKVGSNTLWPYTYIGTAAMNIVSPDAETESKRWRTPAFVAEAAARIFEQDGSKISGQDYIDESYLCKQHGWTKEKVAEYSMGGPDVAFEDLALDLFVSGDIVKKVKSGW